MKQSRKAEMSFTLVIAIVIGLIVLAISAYVIYDKSRQAQAAGKCEALGGLCSAGDGKCPPTGASRDDLTRGSLTPCKPTVNGKPSDTKELLGRCCYPEI